MSKVIGDLAGGELRKYKYPVNGAGTAIVRGSILKRSAANGGGLAIVLAADDACTDVYGLLNEDHAVAGDSVKDGSVWTLREVITNPKAIYEVPYSQVTADLITATSSVGTTVTIGGLEANISGAWLYVVSGTGAGQLRYMATATTTMTAFSPALDGTSLLIKLLPIGHKLVSFKAGGRFLQSIAGVGASVVELLQNRFRTAVGNSDQVLDPTKHNGLLIPAADLPQFFAELTFPNHIAG